MPDTFTLIAASTVGAGGAANIDFTAIPATFTDLCLKLSARSNLAQVYEFVGLRFNGNTTGYSNLRLRGNGTAVSSANNATTSIELEMLNGDTSTSSTFGSMDIYIPNYAGSTAKSVSADGVSENNATLAFASINAGLSTNTAAVTSISLQPIVGSAWLQYSTAYLYGIKKD